MSNDPDFDQESSSEPHLITQGELNDLVSDLELPKNKVRVVGLSNTAVESPRS